MGQLLNRSLFYRSKVRTPDIKKAVATLSTGEIAMLEADPNEATGNGVQQFSLYVLSADRLTRSNPVSFNYSDQDGRTTPYLPRGSMCIDSANNIHVAYVYCAGASEQQRLCYRKATYAAGAYTWGAEQVVSAYVANRFHLAVDIDIPANEVNCPLIAASFRLGTTTFTSTVVLYNRQTAGTWVSQQVYSSSIKLNTTDLSLACKIDLTSGTGALPTFVLTFGPGNVPNGVTDPGDTIYTGRYTIGGAISTPITTVLSGINAKGLNGGFRNYFAFSLTGDFYLIYAEVQSDPNVFWWTVLSVSTQAGSAATQTIPPRTGTHSQYKMFRPAYSTGGASLYRLGNGQYSLASYTVGADSPIRSDIFLTQNGNSWLFREPSTSHLPNAGLFKSATIALVYAGDSSRFANSLSPICITHYTLVGTTSVYKSYIYTRSHMQQIQAISDPSENATKATNKITASMSVNYPPVSGDQTSATYDARVQVQMSTANTFATNLYTATQDVSLEKTYASTAVGVDINLGAYPLTQTTWYMRARMIDSLGNVSAWTATRTFRVSHPAVPTNARPADQDAVAYLNASSTFSWDFSDAYPDDSQRAYRLQVLLTGTQALIYDSNKVVSDADQVSIDIGAANLENNIDWNLTLWDQEDVAGPTTKIGTVLFTTNPTPAITYPVNNADVITTAQPGISWTSGVGGTKTQYSYRILIRTFIDNKLIFDSGLQVSTDTAYNLPPGYLHNNGMYTLDLMIQDSVGLGATVSRSFSTSWTAPVSLPAPVVYPDRHHTHGYVSVLCDLTGIDATVDHVTLYRRSLDQVNSDWEPVYTSLETTNFVFLDYMCPSGVMSEYMVTQTADRFGDMMESDVRTSKRTQYAPKESTFWLIDELKPELSVLLPNVTSNSYTDEHEKTDYTVINGGRQIEEGEHVGITGTLEVQVRPRLSNLGGTDNYNLVANPNLILDSAANIIGATINNAGALTGNPTWGEVNAVPGPGNRGIQKIGLTASKGTATASNIQCGFQSVVPASPYMTYTAGRQYHFSAYVNIPVPVAGYEIRARVQWTLAGVVQSTEVATITNLTTGAGSIESLLCGPDLWFRVGKTVTVPSGVDGAIVQVLVASTGSTILAPITFYVEAMQLTIGPNPIGFFSGATRHSAMWTGVENYDPSYTPGYVSPRFVKQTIEALRKSGHDLHVRTPFGDVWEVYLNDLAVENVAGTGSSEFVNISIPYLQVGNG